MGVMGIMGIMGIMGMLPPRSGVALTLAGLLAVPSAAAAQNQAEVASRWGLIGTWAVDCRKPASDDNPHLTYVIRRAGEVTYERDFGARRDVNRVEQLRVGADGGLELVLAYPQLTQTRRILLVMGGDGRTRATANSNPDGSNASITDGKFTVNGQETPWQTHCR
jgi:hypothetical protein